MMNTCETCALHAYDTATEGMGEIMVDDGEAPNIDTAIALVERDRPIDIMEQMLEMLDDTDCEEWH